MHSATRLRHVRIRRRGRYIGTCIQSAATGEPYVNVRTMLKKTMKALVKKKREPGLWLEEVPVPEVGLNDVPYRQW